MVSPHRGDHYRALADFDGDTFIWKWIGSHEDYNKFSAQAMSVLPIARCDLPFAAADEVALRQFPTIRPLPFGFDETALEAVDATGFVESANWQTDDCLASPPG